VGETVADLLDHPAGFIGLAGAAARASMFQTGVRYIGRAGNVAKPVAVCLRSG
jgi:hypothetical protein